MSESLGPSFTTSHASASVSGTGLVVGIVSGCGTRAKLVTKISGAVGRGIGMGCSRTPTSGAGLLELGVKGNVGIRESEVERLAVDAVFFLQERRVVGNSVICWGESSECSEFLPSSAEPERARLGWLNFLNKRENGMGAI